MHQFAIKKLTRGFFRSQPLHEAAMAVRSPNNKTRKDNILNYADKLLGDVTVVFPLRGQEEQVTDATAQGSSHTTGGHTADQNGNQRCRVIRSEGGTLWPENAEPGSDSSRCSNANNREDHAFCRTRI